MPPAEYIVAAAGNHCVTCVKQQVTACEKGLRIVPRPFSPWVHIGFEIPVVSEEQHRQTPADEHQDDRGDEAGDEWLDAGLRNRLEVHVDAEGGHGHAEEDLRHIAAECVDENRRCGNRLQEQRADGCRGDESEP